MVAPRHESQPLTEKLFNESVETKKARRPRKPRTGSFSYSDKGNSQRGLYILLVPTHSILKRAN